MATQKKARKKRLRLRFGRLFLPLVLAGILGVVALTMLDQQARLDELSLEEESLKQTLEDLSTERARLERMIDYAGTDAYIEQIARDVLGWVKPGEMKYVLPETEQDAADGATPADSEDGD